MSFGSIIGGVVGGVIGFFIGGGPTGAYYGAVLGFSIGMALDPMTPDIPNLGIPNPDENVMKSEIGIPVPDLTGTAKITGHLLCFGNESNQAVYTQATGGGKGGGGGGAPQITGYKYYMSWALGFCACPGDSKINTLYAIYKNDDALPVWSGDLDCPLSGGHETIVLDGIGSVDFYFGTNDQVANSKVAEIISDSTLNTPYRNMSWAFFDDCYIGEYNRTPTYKFIMKKIPEYSFSTSKATVQINDVNPANSMYYILSNLAGLPISWLDSDDFGTIADTLYSEDRGICVLFDRQQSVLSYLESINSHVDNIIRYGSDAKFHPKLIRDDYNVGSIPTIDESVMLEDPSFSRGSWIDTVNELKVQYSEIVRPNADIFGLFAVGSLIWGVHFDGYSLTELGYYESPSGDINGLVFKGNDLLTLGGIGSAASMRTINSETFVLKDEVDPFNEYDAVATSQGTLAIDEITGKVYYTEGMVSGTGGRQIALSSALERESRGFLGSVVIGTDARYYLYDYAFENLGWEVTWRPITGANWDIIWNLIEDDIFDDAVPIIWGGVDTLRTSDASFPRNLVYNNYLYTCMNSSPSGKLRKYNLDDLQMVETVTTSLIYQITAYDGFIYSAEGVSDMTVKKYDADDLSYIDEVALSPGRPGDLTTTDSYIVVLCGPSGGDGSIHKLNSDLEILASSNLGTTLWQMVDGIDDTFVALGGNNGVGVFNIEIMEMVDEISAPVPSGSYYNTQEMIVKSG